MKVVHIAKTPVAGSPFSIVHCLNKYTDVKARLSVINSTCYGARVFSNDLIWPNDRDEFISELETADIVHLHQDIVLEEALPEIIKIVSSKKVIRQWHSAPGLYCNNNPALFYKYINDPYNQLVISQYHPRYYPKARVVPNLIDIETFCGDLPIDFPISPTICFSPSSDISCYSARWETKGAPEISFVLCELKRKCSIDYNVIMNVPYAECLRRKALSSFVIDDLFTGSYHLSSLESLALGKPVACYLDVITETIIKEITGADKLPFIQMDINNAYDKLSIIAPDIAACKEIGYSSRKWMEKYYHPRDLVRYYVDAYNDLLNGCTDWQRGFVVNDRVNAIKKCDLEWANRLIKFDCSQKKQVQKLLRMQNDLLLGERKHPLFFWVAIKLFRSLQNDGFVMTLDKIIRKIFSFFVRGKV